MKGDVFNLLLPEIWREILLRVPVKSILRCRSICKSWHSLISCPDFISNYQIRNLNNRNHVLLKLYDDIASTISYSSHDESFTLTESHEHVDEPFLGRDLDIVGSCNGLICLAETSRDTQDQDLLAINFMIWNPTIRKIVELPPWNFSSRTQYLSCYGFGFDPKTCDFKVLLVVGNISRRNSYHPDLVCEIFDLRKGVWRRISPRADSWACSRQQCYLDGAIHWSATRRVGSRRLDRILLSFDMSDEVFREIKMPSCVESFASTTSVAFGGLIYLLAMKDRSDNVDHMKDYCLSVWVMKEYGVSESWTKVSNVDLVNIRISPHTRILSHTFHIWENGEVLVVRDGDEDFKQKRDFVLFNIGSGEIKSIFSTTQHVWSVCLYNESMMLL